MENNNEETRFLNELIMNRKKVSIYLKNGVRLIGRIIANDKDAIMLDGELILKHAIATINPS